MKSLSAYCPCCGIFDSEVEIGGTFIICPICGWEDDEVQLKNADFSGGANTLSLNQARELYKRKHLTTMRVKLIPIIEITHYNQDIKSPDLGPYYKYADEWEVFNLLCLEKAGFPDKMNPYAKGSGFYNLDAVSDSNLAHQLNLSIEGCERDEIIPFYGGYALNIDGVDMLFPQCCSDLSDIKCWKSLAQGEFKFFWQGHPAPQVNIENGIIIFDMTVRDCDEHFVPTPLQTIVKVAVQNMAEAVAEVEKELEIFSLRLKKINESQNLGLDKIEDLLIYGENN